MVLIGVAKSSWARRASDIFCRRGIIFYVQKAMFKPISWEFAQHVHIDYEIVHHLNAMLRSWLWGSFFTTTLNPYNFYARKPGNMLFCTMISSIKC